MRATSELRFLFSNPNGVKHRRSDVDSTSQQASKVKEVSPSTSAWPLTGYDQQQHSFVVIIQTV